MTEIDQQQANPAGETHAAADPSAPLPRVRLPRDLADAIDRLTTASKRGRLAGFAAGGSIGEVFSTEAYANPFERRLLVFHDAGPAASTGVAEDQAAGTLRFELRLLLKMPIIWAVVLAVTVWPGLPLTDDILATYSDWYAANVETWWWYMPLMILSIPGVWKLWTRSAKEAHASALEMIGKIAAETGGNVIEADGRA